MAVENTDSARAADPYALHRFVLAQDRDQTYLRAVAELRAGRKTSHWMWFVFPQIGGLGRSEMAQHCAISGLDEAKAYIANRVLGPRLVECAQILSDLDASDATAVLGHTDAQKLQSSMTLFAMAAPEQPAFQAVLDKYFAGEHDTGTTARTQQCRPG